MNVTWPLAVSVMYSSAATPLCSGSFPIAAAVRFPRKSGVIPEGGSAEVKIVIGAATAAGGTSIVPLKPAIDGNGAVVDVDSGVKELFACVAVQFGAVPVKLAGHGVTTVGGLPNDAPLLPPHAVKTPALKMSTNPTSAILTWRTSRAAVTPRERSEAPHSSEQTAVLLATWRAAAFL